MASITHITPFAQSGGGMQGIIRRHRELDQAAGSGSRLVAIFETAAGGTDLGLAAGWWWTPGGLRRAFQRDAVPAVRGTLAVYHNAWALPLLAPGDGAERRLAYLHTEWPGLAAAVRASGRWCDGFLCVSQALVTAVHGALPEYPRERVHRIHYPVVPPGDFQPPAPAAAPRPFRLGYVGRLETDQKRVERLPGLMRALTESGMATEWHVLGDGPYRARLEQMTRSAGQVRFHGWLEGAEYWRVLAALDAVVFFSDYEGTPIALLEAMSAGVTPVFPEIGGDGEVLARQVDTACVYPAGDLTAATRCIRSLAAAAADGRRERARKAVAAHTPERYAADFSRVCQVTRDLPRHSATATVRPGRWSDGLPLALVRRYQPQALWC